MPRKPKKSSPLRFLREALQQTQPEFAKLLGISESHLQDMELGTRRVTDDLAKTMSLRWGMAPASIQKPTGRPKLAGGATLPPHSTPEMLRLHLAQWEKNQYSPLNQQGLSNFDQQYVSRLRLLMKTAVGSGLAPILGLELDRWIEAMQRKMNLSSELPVQDRIIPDPIPTEVVDLHEGYREIEQNPAPCSIEAPKDWPAMRRGPNQPD